MKSLYLAIALFPMIAFSADKSEEFKTLEKSIYQKPLTAIEVLLRPYGKIEDFKIFDGSISSEICTNKTVIRANTTCNRLEKVTESIFYAEGNGLLCKINNHLQTIRCLPKISFEEAKSSTQE